MADPLIVSSQKKTGLKMEPNRKREYERRTARGRAAVLAIGLAAVLSAFALWAGADVKKLETVPEKAAVHLDPDPRSPVVETLGRGSILTLASSTRFRTDWLYVQFASGRSGSMRSGYIREALVRKLYPSLRIQHISSEDEILNPKELDTTAGVMPVLEWGVSKERIVQVEGRPLSQEASQGLEILRYRREIMNRNCLVEYAVGRNGLVAARLSLREKYSDKNQYIDDYNTLRAFLNASVGRPRSDNVVWQNRYYERENGRWGAALGMGHLAFSSEWVFRDTSVQLKLSGENDQVVLGAELYDVKAKNPASS